MLLQSCSKEPYNPGCGTPPKSYYFPIKQEALAQTPYFTNPAFDTISFASDKGDTLTFVKTKTDTTWYFENGSGSPDCGFDKVYSQTINNTYTSLQGNGSFNVKHSKKTNIYADIIELKFGNLFFKVTDYRIGTKNGTIYFDSLLVNNKAFYASTCYYHNLSHAEIGKLYLNKEYGCFKIEDIENSTNFTLIN